MGDMQYLRKLSFAWCSCFLLVGPPQPALYPCSPSPPFSIFLSFPPSRPGPPCPPFSLS